MKTGPKPTIHETTMRHAVETIAIAVSKIMGRPHPDPATMASLRKETEELLVDQPTAESCEHLELVIDQMIARCADSGGQKLNGRY